MNIVVGAYSLLYQDLARAFERLGHTVRISGRHDPDGVIHADPRKTHSLVRSGWADAVLLFNGIGLDDGGWLAQALAESRVPHAFWFVDDPDEPLTPWHIDHARFGGALGNPALVALATERAFFDGLHRRGVQRVRHVRLAASDLMIEAGGSPPPAPRRPLCFAGTSLVDLSWPLYRDHVLKEHAEMQPAFDAVIADQKANPNTAIDDVWTNALNRLGVEVEGDDRAIRVILRRVASCMLRCERVAALLDLGIEVLGDDDWAEVIPRERLLPRRPYGPGLAQAYRESTVNVNVTNAQLSAGLNQRVFDVPAGNAFLLTDSKADLAHTFDPAGEVAVYSSPEELHDMAARFLRDQVARRTIVERARKRVLAEHRFEHRARLIAGLLRE